MFVHLKPYLPVTPAEGLMIPAKLLNLTNTQKFVSMYKGPSPILPENAQS